MKNEMTAQVMTIYLGDDDKWRSGLLYPALVEKLKQAGVAGVTVVHGMEGFGANGKLHTSRMEVLFQGLPIIIEAIDVPEKIQAALAVVDEMLDEALVTIHKVQAIRYNKEMRRKP